MAMGSLLLKIFILLFLQIRLNNFLFLLFFLERRASTAEETPGTSDDTTQSTRQHMTRSQSSSTRHDKSESYQVMFYLII